MQKRKLSPGGWLLLTGMGIMIPCYLFTAGNVLLSSWPLYDRNRPALVLLTALCAAGLLAGMRAIDRHEDFFEKNERRILIGAAIFYFIAQIVLAQFLRFTPKTDAEQCFTAAQLIADSGTFKGWERAEIYFERYPFNLGFVYLLAAIFRACNALGIADRFMAAVAVGTALFTPGLLAGARVAHRIGGGARGQAKFLLLCASCLPLLYCTTELYTDAFSVSFPLMIVYCCMKLTEASAGKGRALWAALFALCAFAGAQIRFSAMIAAVACLIWLLMRADWRRLALAGLLLAAVMAAGGALVDRETDKHLDPQAVALHELPKLHHIAMGLPVHEDEGYGQYGDGGWLIFSTSFDDPDERDAALMREIIDRVYYLRYPSRLMNMMSRKLLSTFGDGTFRLNEIIEADDYEADNAVKQVIFAQGKLYRAYYHLCTAMFCAQMILACAACAQRIRRKDTAGAAVFIALVGIFLVLCAWETRARYFFQFIMVLLCAAAAMDCSPKHKEN